ncbi:TPA: hypothetical protein CPT92_01990 [Candidatus Gastranaerophilales bacterium HUM_13]|nr:ATP synthase F0 subunit B [Acinetobacter sp.]DAB02846.1 MAG TPA: hypothetical protein CPT96_01890 [Candidatus Gastranaerophilales bacterium HUM_10]DAB09420.1 MAG TPA: hypothetical protein CPT92_01990 [Candidatus Gastranaerophilales bacterium HUM_13]DAB13210.1 MAG TPA: hypothetical protein CPU00_12145 [Candidatus Gastranaerophilales bacterium HUM_18]
MEFNGTFLVTIISFVLFVFVMNKILYEPINNIVAQRREFVDENLRTAEKNHKKANEISAQKEEKLKGARNDARNKYSDSVVDFKNKKNDILKNAQFDADNELMQTYENLNNLSNEAKEGLKGRMTDLANDIVEKMIGYRSEVQGFDNDAVNRILYQG